MQRLYSIEKYAQSKLLYYDKIQNIVKIENTLSISKQNYKSRIKFFLGAISEIPHITCRWLYGGCHDKIRLIKNLTRIFPSVPCCQLVKLIWILKAYKL